MEKFLYSEIYNANHHSVEAEDEHGADGNQCYQLALDAVE
jgi:hypothetical protein